MGIREFGENISDRLEDAFDESLETANEWKDKVKDFLTDRGEVDLVTPTVLYGVLGTMLGITMGGAFTLATGNGYFLMGYSVAGAILGLVSPLAALLVAALAGAAWGFFKEFFKKNPKNLDEALSTSN